MKITASVLYPRTYFLHPIMALIVVWSSILVGTFQIPSAFAQDHTATMQTVLSSALSDQVAVGQSLKLNDVVLDSASSPVSLELERFEVFAPDARIVVHQDGAETALPPPKDAYYRGGIAGKPDSLAVLSADANGVMRGIVQEGEKFWILAGGAEAGGPRVGLTSRELKQSGLSNTVEPFQCGVDKLPKALRTPRLTPQEAIAPQALAAGRLYNVPVAIETDGEFFALFGNSSAATSYIGNLFAYASTIYQREASTKLTVSYVSLWAGGPASDPWNHTETYQGLTNFQSYWNTHRTGVKRAIAHFLSARHLGGGIAYVGVLCDGSYGYGYSANLSGDFQLNNPQPVWDLVVVTHEIGHNFNSPHTHDYEGIGNNSNPVDACTNGNLPGLNSLTGGTPGAGNGTIMSYCHLLGGGLSNIALKFGLNHPYGIAASRVSTVISSHVSQTASAYPSCISIVGSSNYYTLTVAKAGTGTGTVTSNPAGINCGTDCNQTYATNTTVILTPISAAGSVFAGWSGACTGTAPCKVTMSTTKNVTATFNRSTTTYSLTVAKAGTGTGTVTGSPAGINCGADCTQTYAVNTIVFLTPISAAGSVFTGWSGACTGTATCKITINAARNVTATFNRSAATYALTVAKAGTGTGAVTSSPAGINCGADCHQTYAVSAAVTLTATPASGSRFSGWTGPCTGTSTCRVTMAGARNVTATFTKLVGGNPAIPAVTSPSAGMVWGSITGAAALKN